MGPILPCPLPGHASGISISDCSIDRIGTGDRLFFRTDGQLVQLLSVGLHVHQLPLQCSIASEGTPDGS